MSRTSREVSPDLCPCVQVPGLRLHLQAPEGRRRILGRRCKTLPSLLIFCALVLHCLQINEEKNCSTCAQLIPVAVCATYGLNELATN